MFPGACVPLQLSIHSHMPSLGLVLSQPTHHYNPFIGFPTHPGFGDRLLNEVRRLAPRDVKIRISAPPERKYSTWIGGCVASTRDFEEGPL